MLLAATATVTENNAASLIFNANDAKVLTCPGLGQFAKRALTYIATRETKLVSTLGWQVDIEVSIYPRKRFRYYAG
jgi:hypothetical protein